MKVKLISPTIPIPAQTTQYGITDEKGLTNQHLIGFSNTYMIKD
jgi:hypothetical protein